MRTVRLDCSWIKTANNQAQIVHRPSCMYSLVLQAWHSQSEVRYTGDARAWTCSAHHDKSLSLPYLQTSWSHQHIWMITYVFRPCGKPGTTFAGTCTHKVSSSIRLSWSASQCLAIALKEGVSIHPTSERSARHFTRTSIQILCNVGTSGIVHCQAC